jgi:hypothetical protein
LNGVTCVGGEQYDNKNEEKQAKKIKRRHLYNNHRDIKILTKLFVLSTV